MLISQTRPTYSKKESRGRASLTSQVVQQELDIPLENKIKANKDGNMKSFSLKAIIPKRNSPLM